MTQTKLDTFTLAYIEAALWSSTGDPYGECPSCGKTALLCRWDADQTPVCEDCSEREPHHTPPLDDQFSASDIDTATLEEMIADCVKFQDANAADLSDYPTENAGHDFWLTRNGHGCGFWENDFGTEEQCERLTEACKALGEYNLYVGDDGKIHGA